MKLVPVTQPGAADLPRHWGAKARHLQLLARGGVQVPPTLVVPPQAYRDFLAAAGLGPAVAEFLRRVEAHGRWEQVWEAALGLRARFMAAAVPPAWEAAVVAGARSLGPGPWAVRSCALEEDGRLSHAGLHDSVLDVDEAGLARAVRQVWASLWSDRAVLYRAELGLDPDASAMAVLLQPMVPGRVSGVLFTASPLHEGQAVVEAAAGSARGVVDDAAALHRVVVERGSGRVLAESGSAVLDAAGVQRLLQVGAQVEALVGAPQDVEWTMDEAGVVVLQARPVTTLRATPDPEGWRRPDTRPWYLSLSRTHANLKRLHAHLTTDLLPAMEAEAAAQPPAAGLADAELLQQLRHLQERLRFWEDAYFRHCIPLAHAVRQLGTLVTDVLAPDDAFAFLDLLHGTDLTAVRRNQALQAMARQAAQEPSALAALERGEVPPLLAESVAAFRAEFGDLVCATSWCEEGEAPLARLLASLAAHPQGQADGPRRAERARHLEERLLAAAPDPALAREILHLARAAYALRDNDNLSLGRLRARLAEAEAEARRRGLNPPPASSQKDAAEAWEAPAVLHGTPAAAGLAHGPAWVVRDPRDLVRLRPGAILVADALDPTMTFVIPLVAGIVERRGGLLVHGAIIAREYGIPCVTGVEGAVERIPDGAWLTVDGFRGEVRLAPS